MDINTQIQSAATGAETAAVQTPIATPAPAPAPESAPEGGSVEEPVHNEKIQWITLLILGLSVVSLVMNIISNKKQIEKLSEDDKSATKKLKELEMNLRKSMGNKYESLD